MSRPKSSRASLPLVLLWPGVCALGACLQVLDIQEARLDSEASSELQEEASVLSEESAVEACELSFDNARVTRLTEAQLTPLPEQESP